LASHPYFIKPFAELFLPVSPVCHKNAPQLSIRAISQTPRERLPDEAGLSLVIPDFHGLYNKLQSGDSPAAGQRPGADGPVDPADVLAKVLFCD
jgi:hypothetical protein